MRALLLSAALLLPSFSHAAPYKITWLLGHPNLDYFEEAAQAFKQRVETESNGDIQVTIVTAEQDPLGDVAQAKEPPEIARRVAAGEAEMGHSFANVLGDLDPRMQVFEAPYLFRGYRHLEGVFEGPAGQKLLDGLKDHGLAGLSFTYSGGANGVAAPGRELRGPEDLKGLKVGVYGGDVDSAWLKALGAVPVAIRHDRQRIRPMAADGSLDAVVITWRNFERASLERQFRTFGLPGVSYLVSVTYANPKFLASLPPKYRALIERAARDSGRIERAQTIELNEMSKREMVAQGVLPVYSGAAARAAFEKAVAPAIDGAVSQAVGAELIKTIRETPDAPVAPVLPRPLDIARR